MLWSCRRMARQLTQSYRSEQYRFDQHEAGSSMVATLGYQQYWRHRYSS